MMTEAWGLLVKHTAHVIAIEFREVHDSVDVLEVLLNLLRAQSVIELLVVTQWRDATRTIKIHGLLAEELRNAATQSCGRVREAYHAILCHLQICC